MWRKPSVGISDNIWPHETWAHTSWSPVIIHCARRLPCTHVTTRSELSVCFPKLLSSEDLLRVSGHQRDKFGRIVIKVNIRNISFIHTFVQVTIFRYLKSEYDMFKKMIKRALLLKINATWSHLQTTEFVIEAEEHKGHHYWGWG